MLRDDMSISLFAVDVVHSRPLLFLHRDLTLRTHVHVCIRFAALPVVVGVATCTGRRPMLPPFPTDEELRAWTWFRTPTVTWRYLGVLDVLRSQVFKATVSLPPYIEPRLCHSPLLTFFVGEGTYKATLR